MPRPSFFRHAPAVSYGRELGRRLSGFRETAVEHQGVKWQREFPGRGEVTVSLRSWVMIGTLGTLAAASPLQSQENTRPTRTVFLPGGDLFSPLISDPKEMHFYASYLRETVRRDGEVGSVAFGTNMGIIRWSFGGAGDGVQIGLAGGVFAQFNLDQPSAELANADYLIGLPITYRRGAFSARLRIYHQSSHLGDEFILRTNPVRQNLRFQSIELLLSREFGPFRGYGGGELRFGRDPRERLKRGVLHGGGEYRHRTALFRLGSLGSARPLVSLDTKAWQQLDWNIGWSGRAGIEFASDSVNGLGSRRLSFLVEWYDGPIPFGQFFEDDTSYLGFGFHVFF